MNSKNRIFAWHWAKSSLRTQHSNERIVAGKTLKGNRPLELCDVGLNASLCPLRALTYAAGPMLCRVQLSGDILCGADKLCASRHKVLWIADADGMLNEFACRCAERALRAANVKDPRGLRAIEAKRLWMGCKTTCAELDAARGSARSASIASPDPGISAALSSASDAALSASWEAACDAASTAARAAGSIAWDAVDAEGGGPFDAARDALSAAMAAEADWQRETLLTLIRRLPEYKKD
jgi:hypothetical protein